MTRISRMNRWTIALSFGTLGLYHILRTTFTTSAIPATGELSHMKKLACLLTLVVLPCTTTTKADELAKGFKNPPDAARSHTFWMWMNGNVTKEGITVDLEAMKGVGIGGVLLFLLEGHLTESVPVYIDQPVYHLTPEWFAMLRHSAAPSRCAWSNR